MFSVVPTKILYDERLTPQAKVALLVIYDRVKTNKINLNHFDLGHDMRYAKSEEEIIAPPTEYLDSLIQEMVDLGYVKRNNNTVTILTEILKEVEKPTATKQKSEVDKQREEDAKEILNYLSEARISRGHSKRALTSSTFIDQISMRLKDGATVEDCIMVINYAFLHDNWLSANEKYLSVPTLFAKSNFAKYLASADGIEGIKNQRITATGFTVEQEEEETISF